jgi:nitroreductase
MEYHSVVEARRSVRSFEQKKIPSETLKKIISTAMLAPSAGNMQAYKVVVVKDQARKKKLALAAFGQEYVAEAPACLVVCADEKRSESGYGSRGRNLYSIQDATIFAAYLELTAVEFGLSTVWVGAFDEKEAAKAVNAEPGVRPIILLPIGHAKTKPPKTRRRNYVEMVSEEQLKGL